jgi:DNA polymerase V
LANIKGRIYNLIERMFVNNEINMDIEISTEFPSLDLNKILIKNPISTFYGRVKGVSMKDAGIDDGDLLVIDKSLEYRNNAFAVCCLNGEFTLKRIKVKDKRLFLVPANSDLNP